MLGFEPLSSGALSSLASPAAATAGVFMRGLGTIGCETGCGCAGTCAPVTICVTMCGTTPVVGASVTIKSGATVIASGTTTSGGCVTLTIPSPTLYSVIVSATGLQTQTNSIGLTCGGTFGVNLALAVPQICCGGVPVPKTLYWTICGTTIPLAASFGFVGAANITSSNVADVDVNCTALGSTSSQLTSYGVVMNCTGSTTSMTATVEFCTIGGFPAPNQLNCGCGGTGPAASDIASSGVGGPSTFTLTGTMFPVFSLTGTMPSVGQATGAATPCAGYAITVTS